MTNPHNNSDVYEMPRRTLEQIIARTGFDTELYRHAARIRHSRPVPADALTPEVQIARPPIAVADLIRVSPLVLGRARLGKELRIAGNEVLLHPPPATEGHASVVIDNVPLSGHGEIAGRHSRDQRQDGRSRARNSRADEGRRGLLVRVRRTQDRG